MTDAVPWVKWRFDKWRGDEGLRMCSLAARGLWVELLAVMHSGTPYGHLAIKGKPPTPAQIASLVGMTNSREVTALLSELEEAGVFSRSDNGLIYNRRMVRDNAARIKGAAFGSMGGNPNLTGERTQEDNAPSKPETQPTAITGGVNPTPKDRERERERGRGEEEQDSSLRSDGVTAAFAAWNSVAGTLGLATAKALSADRRQAIAARLREHGGLPGWNSALAELRASPFLLGEGAGGWMADLDFFSRAKPFRKILEGGFRRASAQRVNGHGKPGRMDWAASELGLIPDPTTIDAEVIR